MQPSPVADTPTRAEAKGLRLAEQARQRLTVEDLGNEQHGIGARKAGLQELVTVEDKVLA